MCKIPENMQREKQHSNIPIRVQQEKTQYFHRINKNWIHFPSKLGATEKQKEEVPMEERRKIKSRIIFLYFLLL